jgi:NitT/TauT family transport system substrate-binding protein
MKVTNISLLVVALLLQPIAAQAQKLETVSLRIAFTATGIDAFWLYGRDRGFFADEGIDLQIGEGKGSAISAQSVATGTDDFGVDVEGGTFLALATKGLPATAIMTTMAKSPLAVLSPASAPLKQPHDLIGKRIGVTLGGSSGALFPVLLSRNGVPGDSVHEINLQPGPALTALLTKSVDGVATFVTVQASLEQRGLKTHALMFADYGVSLPGAYLIAGNDLLKRKPDMVRRFLAAAQRSFLATENHPDAAAASFSKAYPSYGQAAALAELKLAISLLKSPSTGSDALGAVSIPAAQEGVKALEVAGMVPPRTDVSKYLNGSFLPK